MVTVRFRALEDVAVSHASAPTRRSFLRVAGAAIAACFAGGAASVALPGRAAAGLAEDDCILDLSPADLDNCPNKAPRKGYTPSTNGCGAASGLASKIPVPDSFGKADFGPACDAHDVCYGTCGSSQQACDEELLYDAGLACVNAYEDDPLMMALCWNQALTYRDAVATPVTGGLAWKSGQEEGCQCCHPVVVYCGPLDACYRNVLECQSACKVNLGTFAENICGPPPEGKCE